MSAKVARVDRDSGGTSTGTALSTLTKAYAFGPFVLDIGRRALYRAGLAVEMPAKIFEIILCLVSKHDRVVTKEMLVEEVWAGSPIGDNNIAQHMHLVREILGDLSKPYQYVATVHGRGYRFVAEVRRTAAPASDAPAHTEVVPHALATELYSNAVYFSKVGTPAALESSLRLCRRALELHPNFPDPYAHIAIVEILKAAHAYASPAEQFEIARRYASQALRMDPRNARGHLVMAALALFDDYDFDKAGRHIDAAIEVTSHTILSDVLGIVLQVARRDLSAARRAAAEAVTRHPSSTAIAAYASFALYFSGDFERAATQLERLLIFRPTAAFPRFLLGRTRLAQGDYFKAREQFQTLLMARVSVTPSYEKFRQRAIGALSFIEARTGERAEAKALAKDVQRTENCSYLALAVARAGAGEEEAVYSCLQQARAQRDLWFPFAAIDPLFREFHDLPEFQESSALVSASMGSAAS